MIDATDIRPASPVPSRRRRAPWILLPLALGAAVVLILGPKGPARATGPIPQEVYVWQRAYTPAVADAIRKHGAAFAAVRVLAAEVTWNDGKLAVTRVDVDYAPLADAGVPVGLALRIGAYSGPFLPGDDVTRRLTDLAEELVRDARAAGVEPAELHIDFDCPTDKLAGYGVWVSAIRRRVATPVLFTALPDWLSSPNFALLVQAADWFVLQVHSLRRPESPDKLPALCEVSQARRAVERAAKFGVPFRVALPTYGYKVAFDSEGKYLGISAEGPGRRWPEGATIRELRADPAAMADLVAGWTKDRTPFLTRIVWYRLPTPADTLNWRWPTLAAVMAGEVPKADLRAELRKVEPGLVEIDLHNAGTADAPLDVVVKAVWNGDALTASDGINGFAAEAVAPESLRLARPADAPPARLGPGERITVAWMRLDTDREVEVDVFENKP